MQKLVDESLTNRMYAALISLEAGTICPADIYIADYANGEIPAWYVVENRPQPNQPDMHVLTLEDKNNFGKVDLFNPDGRPARKMVIATPRKILGSPIYLPVEGRIYGPPMLHNLVQNALLNRKALTILQEQAA